MNLSMAVSTCCTPRIPTSSLTIEAFQGLDCRSTKFVIVIVAAKHLTRYRIDVVKLAARKALHRNVSVSVLGHLLGGPALDVLVAIRTAVNKSCHISKMSGSAPVCIEICQRERLRSPRAHSRHLS